MIRKHPFLYYTGINSILWIAVHIALSFIITRLPVSLFKPDFWLFRNHAWEHNGNIYNLLFIKKWKWLLPDGAILFTGALSKKHLSRKDPEYLKLFIYETCRAEAVHWLSLFSAPLFILWNTPVGGLVNGIYAVIVNIPFIVTQRFNRPHLLSLLRRIKDTSSKHHHQCCT